MARQTPKIGSAVSASLTRNCMLCTRFLMCRDSNKAMDYACSKFTNETPEESLEQLRAFAAESTAPSSRELEMFKEAEGEEGIEAIIERVINSGVPVPPDLRINDRDIKRPKNFLDWTTGKHFLGEDQPPFAKQIQVVTHLLSEWCPRCSDEDYFENVPKKHTPDQIQERVTFLEHGKCPKCKWNRSELVAEEILNDYNELVGIAGQRSGKTITITLAESYNTARWLLTSNIPATYKILPSAVLTSNYTALTFKQARDNIWRPLKAIFDSSPWFSAYHKMLQEEGYKRGEEIFNKGEESLYYRHTNMFLAPMSPSKRTMRGATRISAVIDELGWYPNGPTKGGQDFERLDAKEVYTALRRSLTTIRNAYKKRSEAGYFNLPKSLMMNISSPSSVNDMIMTLERRHRGSKTVYAFKYPTWKFNPDFARKDFDEEYRTNAVEAERDFGCNPPIALNAWLKEEKVVIRAFGDRGNAIEVQSGRYKTKSTKVLTSANHEIKKDYWPEYSALLCLDAGYNNNSFAFAIVAPKELPDEDQEDSNVQMVVYAVGEIIPRTEAPVSFTHVYKNLLLPICNELPIAAVVSDRWQNIKMMQDLEENSDVETLEMRLNYNDFKIFREGLYEGAIQMNRLERDPEDIMGTTLDNYPHCFNGAPVSHLLYQFLTVKDTGNAVVKGDGTDDIMRCIVLGYTALQDPEVQELIEEFDNRDAGGPMQALGAVAGGIRGASGGSMASGRNGAGIGVARNLTQGRSGGTGNLGATASKGGR